MVLSAEKKENIEKNNLIKKIKKEIKQLDIFKEIKLAILFGSRAKGDHSSDSDLDLAFLFNLDFFIQSNSLNLRLDLINYFSTGIGLETDVIILNSAKPLLKFQVLKYGELIAVNDDFNYGSYFSKSLKEYFDFSYYKEYHYKMMRDRLTKST